MAESQRNHIRRRTRANVAQTNEISMRAARPPKRWLVCPASLGTIPGRSPTSMASRTRRTAWSSPISPALTITMTLCTAVEYLVNFAASSSEIGRVWSKAETASIVCIFSVFIPYSFIDL
ncbi:Uncharacterized protein Rs2_02582 [Raphanus sativus]|nr:Uncharacterized protein Rs2_02582 [Raphanus sativus]